MLNYKKISGFSLVELSIVLVIAGLAIAAITTGSHLLQSAKLNKVISEISGYATAINNFRDKYKAWPGDIPNATGYWGVYDASTNPNGVTNGDGNEQITIGTEGVRAWQELALAGLIAGKYTGVLGTINWQAGVNTPASSVKGGSYAMANNAANGVFNNSAGMFLALSKISADGTHYNNSVISASDAYLVDKKMDDGNPSAGSLYGIQGLDTGGCTNPAYTTRTSSTIYVLTTYDSILCRLWYWF